MDTTAAFSSCATGNKRKELAERFTNYLTSQNTQESAYVVNLNGAWGTGKTYFITEWKKYLEEQKHIAVKIDAWESDYLNDPLAIIIAELLEQIKSHIDHHSPQYRNAERNVASAMFSMGKAALPIVSKMLGKHFLGEAATIEILELIGKETDEIVNYKTVKEDLNLGDLGLEVVNEHKKHKAFVQDFKKQVRDFANFALNKSSPEKQVFVFIDELDRCRPTYAIEMLETVKHLFDIPDFIFILSTDTDQLQHSIKAVYGHKFDSYEYLSRFFEQRLILPEPNFYEFLTAQEIFKSVEIKSLDTLPHIPTVEALRAAVALICEHNKLQLSLRRVKQICDRLTLILRSKELDGKAYPILTLIGLLFGNSLYGGVSDGKSNLDKARLGLSDFLTESDKKIKSSAFNIYKSERGSQASLLNVIDKCITALRGIKHSNIELSSHFSVNKTHYHYANDYNLYFLKTQPFPILPENLYGQARKIYDTTASIIYDENELLNVIENLDIPIAP